ncbi:outer membrane protein E [Psychrobacter sp. JCM 18903]|uniref:hypothetical protein n=1 Tax=Psychrobacter sp. JCM 18903 TaxID=1298610 RepID=UPI0004357A48|nr:hypothetical protein [Psychrobacter sp. JCM 18903]GAF62531.1 outer membrane protein E [Psychrobacter sp. JCM 18903]
MSHQFPISKLTLALITLSAASLTQAAGLDRSGQDIKGFFNSGTYAEIDYAYIDSDVSGNDNAGAIRTSPTTEIRNGITSDEASYEKGALLVILLVIPILLCATV